MGGFHMGEKQARRLAEREVRQVIADLIRKCEQKERQAAQHLKEALAVI